jgi:hypothetical protein
MRNTDSFNEWLVSNNVCDCSFTCLEDLQIVLCPLACQEFVDGKKAKFYITSSPQRHHYGFRQTDRGMMLHLLLKTTLDQQKFIIRMIIEPIDGEQTHLHQQTVKERGSVIPRSIKCQWC